jgi:RNA polymerase sigma factor (sigma-70 family)
MTTDQVEDSELGGEMLTPRPRAHFDDFYRAEFPRLVALARALCGPAVADDVAQEAMLAAYRKWKQVGDLQYPAGWVRRTCANIAVSQHRRRMIELRVLTRLAARRQPTPLESCDDEFWGAVRRLPARQAQSAALRYVYQLDIADIARTLEISEGSVKQHLSRARARLAQDLQLDRDSTEEVER